MANLFNPRKIALGIGVVFTAIGALGFVPGMTDGRMLFGTFATGEALNLIHLGIGLIALWASQAATNVRQTLTALAAAFALLVGAGFVAPFGQTLGLNGADTAIHLVALVLTGWAGLVDRGTVTA